MIIFDWIFGTNTGRGLCLTLNVDFVDTGDYVVIHFGRDTNVAFVGTIVNWRFTSCGFTSWGCERDVVHRMNEGYRAWGTLKIMLINRGQGIEAKKCLYGGVIFVITALCGAEACVWEVLREGKWMFLRWSIRSLVGVSRMDRVGNEEVRSWAGIERELTSRADQRVLRLFGHWKEWMNTVWPEGCWWRK